jgi:MFS family permease
VPRSQYFRSLPPLLLPLVALNLFAHIAISGGRVTSALYALNAGASEFLVGALIGLYGLLPMLLALSMGRWVDRVGPFVPMRAGVVLVATGVALPAMLPHIATLFATAALCGLGFTIVSVAAQHSVGRLQQDSVTHRVANFGWLALGHSTSSVLGPIIVGIVIDRVGYASAFAALAASAAVSLAVVLKYRTQLRALHMDKPHETRPDVWTLVGQPAMRRIYIVGALLAISWDLFAFLIPILGHRRQLSASTIGAILAAFAAGTFGVRLIMAWLARRFAEWHILRAAIIVIVAIYLLVPLTPSVPLLFAFAFILGTAVGCSQPNMLSLLHASAPRGRGAEAVAVRNMLGSASSVFVPFLFGATAASLGLVPVFWSVAALVAAAFPAAHRASRD